MPDVRRPLVAGNWKMNGLRGSVSELDRIIAGARELSNVVDLMVCPPVTLLAAFAAQARGSAVAIGAQDCHAEPSGAFTGDISAEMLKDAGASAVIVGHSERRSLHRETRRGRARQGQGGRPGRPYWRSSASARRGRSATPETRLRSSGHSSMAHCRKTRRLPSLVVAYEPVWAIGTGLTPTSGDVAEMHGFIRQRLAERLAAAGQGVRILYGGFGEAVECW